MYTGYNFNQNDYVCCGHASARVTVQRVARAAMRRVNQAGDHAPSGHANLTSQSVSSRDVHVQVSKLAPQLAFLKSQHEGAAPALPPEPAFASMAEGISSVFMLYEWSSCTW